MRGTGDMLLQGWVSEHLGDAHHATDNLAAARDAYQRALTILTELDHPKGGQVKAKLDNLDRTA